MDELFERSRINAVALRPHLQAVPVSDVVSDAVASAGPVAAAKRVQLSGGCCRPASGGGAARARPGLGNLLSHAIRHPPDGVVHLEADVQDEQVVLRVAGRVRGIPAEDLPRLFAAAFRGTQAGTPDGESGAGFGLTIARGLVEVHHGDIRIENAGSGCRVGRPPPGGVRGVAVQAPCPRLRISPPSIT